MRTHVKESLATVATFLALVGTVHAGIWFHLFGVPDVTVLNWPFHYFWFVIGAWASIFVIYGLYHRFVDTIEAEKRGLQNAHDGVSASTAESTPEGASEGGGD